MVGLLYALICLGSTCQVVEIPTPNTFTCDSSFEAQPYLDREYPQWEVRQWKCEKGRIA